MQEYNGQIGKEGIRKRGKRGLMLLVKEVVAHASARKLEWIMAGMFIHLGYILSQPADTFANPSFMILKTYMAENGWAWLFGAFGFVRLIILFLNGTHIKQSAELRMVLSGFSFIVLVMWVWGIDAANVASTGGATYKWLALGELANVWQASADRQARVAGKINGKHSDS